MKRTLVLGVGVVVMVGLGACGGDDGDSGTDGGEGADRVALDDVVEVDGDPAQVEALDNRFTEQNIRVEPGTTVVWENLGRQDHDVVPVPGGGGWGVDQEAFAPGDVYEHTFDEPGTYRYYCSLHGNEDTGMVGAVVVE